MNTKIFNSGDSPYLKWISENKNGYILNIKGTNKNNMSITLHASKCKMLSSKKGKDGKFTTRGYSKVCSLNIENLIQWISSNRPGRIIRACQCCKIDFQKYSGIYPDEISSDVPEFPEGLKKIVTINSYERNTKAREACIKHYGYRCKICNFDFSDFYGKEFHGYIHIHHIVPLHKIKKTYIINPIKDLIPLCPNCHAAIHLMGDNSSIEKLKKQINHSKNIFSVKHNNSQSF